jgi:pimeloyl-ACP methyl ester carboxylesterase
MGHKLRTTGGAMKRIFALACALLLSACVTSEGKRFPRSDAYPPEVMTRVTLVAGVPEGWNLSALTTRRPNAPWKLVIITGTPSLSEYWAPTLAGAPNDIEVVVADRPGFGPSGPATVVNDIATQARALSVLLKPTVAGQKVILIGQSYGGPIATMMAATYPDQVSGLVLVSAFFGERGPTIKRLSFAGGLTRGVIGRDLRNGLDELRGQAPQLPAAFGALDGLKVPIVVLHGAKDSFVTIDAAQRLATRAKAPLVPVPEGDHFLNACCVTDIFKAVALVQEQVTGGQSAVR